MSDVNAQMKKNILKSPAPDFYEGGGCDHTWKLCKKAKEAHLFFGLGSLYITQCAKSSSNFHSVLFFSLNTFMLHFNYMINKLRTQQIASRQAVNILFTMINKSLFAYVLVCKHIKTP